MAEALSPPTDHAKDYAQIAYDFAVEASKDRYGKKHCKWVRLAAKRHLADLKKQSRKTYPYKFDEWCANDICDFAEKFPHIEGEWDSETITLEPPQIFILCCVFGWRKKYSGHRRFTTVYIEMARKGAKSTLTAVIALYCLACEGEVGPQIIIGATTGEQANKVFNPARQMAKKSPDFCEINGIEVLARSIACSTSGGFIQTINARSDTQDGWNPYVSVLDELHAHKDRGLYDVMRSAMGARKSPLLWIITTAGYNIAGVCYDQHKFVKQILQDVVVADHYFGIIFTLDEKDDVFDESKWIKANPLLGITPSIESMREYAVEAKSSPDSLGEFKTKRLNVWSSARGAWLSLPKWKKNGGAVSYDDLRGVPVYGGLDLSSIEDITAWVLVAMVNGRLKVVPKFWLPEETIKPRTERANLPYESWVEQGYLEKTPGAVIDYKYVERQIRTDFDQLDIRQIGYDKWNSSQLVNNLDEEGIPMVRVIQGPITYNPAMKEVERLYSSRLIDHGGHPVLEWMASNVVTKPPDDNNNIAPSRRRSGEKIDGMVAMLMAVERMLFAEQAKPSIYESRGLI